MGLKGRKQEEGGKYCIKRSIFCIPLHCYLMDQIKDVEKEREYGRDLCIGVWWGNLKEVGHLENLVMCGK